MNPLPLPGTRAATKGKPMGSKIVTRDRSESGGATGSGGVAREPGLQSLADEYFLRDNGPTPNVDTFSRLAAVANYGNGVTPSDLADFIDDLASLGMSRVLTIGAQQYSGEKLQKFETMTEKELIAGFLEEISDAQNYLAMLTIRVLATYVRAQQ